MKIIHQRLLASRRDVARLLIGVLLVILFDLSIFNRYFPLTEGWWETYGDLINKGWVPYKDFNLAFPPVIPTIYAKAIQLFGVDFYAFRLLGIGVHAVVVCLLIVWLRHFVSTSAAVTAVVLGSFLAMSNSTYIVKDYHLGVDALLAATLALVAQGLRWLRLCTDEGYKFNRCGRRVDDVRTLLAFGLSGTCVAVLALVKQNVGILFGIGLIVSALTYLPLRTGFAVVSSSLIGAAMGILVIQMGVPGWDLSQFVALASDNDAKGSIVTVLTRAVTDPLNKSVIVGAVIIFFAFAVSQKLSSSEEIRKTLHPLLPARGDLGSAWWIYSFSVAVLLVIYWASFYSVVIPFAIAVLMSYAAMGRGHDNDGNSIAMFVPALLLLAYANTTTASFNFAGMYIPIVFASAVVFERLRFSKLARRVGAIILGTILITVVGRKWILPYEWWGYDQGPIFSATREVGVSELEGIYVDQDTRDAFIMVNSLVDQHSLSKTDALFYPSIPIFYLLNDKLPPFHAVVQWFDVITDKQAIEMLRAFENDPPRVVVLLDPPEFVYEGHARLKGDALVQSNIRNAIVRAARNGKYRLVGTKVLESRARRKILYKTSALTVEVLNEDLVGKDWLHLCGRPCDPSQIAITSWRRRDGAPLDRETTLRLGDVVSLTAPEQVIDEIIESAGRQLRQDRYVLQVFVRPD